VEDAGSVSVKDNVAVPDVETAADESANDCARDIEGNAIKERKLITVKP